MLLHWGKKQELLSTKTPRAIRFYVFMFSINVYSEECTSEVRLSSCIDFNLIWLGNLKKGPKPTSKFTRPGNSNISTLEVYRSLSPIPPNFASTHSICGWLYCVDAGGITIFNEAYFNDHHRMLHTLQPAPHAHKTVLLRYCYIIVIHVARMHHATHYTSILHNIRINIFNWIRTHARCANSSICWSLSKNATIAATFFFFGLFFTPFCRVQNANNTLLQICEECRYGVVFRCNATNHKPTEPNHNQSFWENTHDSCVEMLLFTGSIDLMVLVRYAPKSTDNVFACQGVCEART